jgi:hypothetical protein
MPRQPAGKSTRPTKGAPRKRSQSKRAAAKAPVADGPDTAFVDALSVDFQRYGASAIAQVREADPTTYMKLCASILPKSVIGGVDPLATLSDEDLYERARLLAEKAGIGPGPDVERDGEAEES